MSRGTQYTILLSLIFICLIPLFAVLIPSFVANIYGCTLSENNPPPCIVNGEDIAGTLSGITLLGWLMILTLPAAALVGVLLALRILWDLVQWVRRR